MYPSARHQTHQHTLPIQEMPMLPFVSFGLNASLSEPIANVGWGPLTAQWRIQMSK